MNQNANTNTHAKADVNADGVNQLIESNNLIKSSKLLPQFIEFPDALPVNAKRREIELAIQSHQVIVVCGETGSGKTTQLPKICLNLGRGRIKTIGHTQPRRLAATSTAKRIAQELNSPVGDCVGYKIRFQDKSQCHTAIKLMTDGILLAETQSDPLLTAYDTLIIDEAHERSLNIDFLLGYLKRILPQRLDLKLIITSATIDAQRFVDHFQFDAESSVPIIEVSGRTYPVEIRYRPIEQKATDVSVHSSLEQSKGKSADYIDETNFNLAIVQAVEELCSLGCGDILVFLPGEREIKDAAQALYKHTLNLLRGVEILPLFARLSLAEQEKVFSGSGSRRVVLATNVAETSLTVPGVRFVVDTGLARVKRYSYRNKVEQLLIEPVAQSSANQRAGRCGRVAAGVCIRLYSEMDFQARPRFADPEILRASLAGVILRMKALSLGDISAFPFLQAPSGRAIADGQQLLAELNAVDENGLLTKVGRDLSRLPLDPRIGRMVLAAHEQHCLAEVLVIASALSVQDPRERPMHAQDAADQAHRVFTDEQSDFFSYLKIWALYEEQLAQKMSNRKLHAFLQAHFLSPMRMRQWREVHAQLLSIVTEQGWRLNSIPAQLDMVAQSLLAGLLGNLGCKHDTEAVYLGARGIKFYLHPSSALVKKAGRWVMSAELVETTRLYARCIGKIQAQWLERVGRHLIKSSWHDPHWEKKSGQVTASERGTLYGLVVYNNRPVYYANINRTHAREIFIRQALVAGDWDSRLPFFLHNQRLLKDVEQIEHTIRRQDVLVDDELIYQFYDHHLPESVYDVRSLEGWWKQASLQNSKLLHLERDDLIRKQAGLLSTEMYPKVTVQRGVRFDLTYHFEPGSVRDGITMAVPLLALNQVNTNACEWLVPGMLKEKVLLLIKSLPARLRRHCVPLPEYAAAFCNRFASAEKQLQPLVDTLLQDIIVNTPARPIVSDFRVETLPLHLLMNFKLIDEHGRQLDMQRSLSGLKAQWQKKAQGQFQTMVGGVLAQINAKLSTEPMRYDITNGPFEKQIAPKDNAQAAVNLSSNCVAEGLYQHWAFGELPELLEIKRDGQTLLGYPALVDVGNACRLDVFDDPELALENHRKGVKRLFSLGLNDNLKYLDKNLPDLQRCAILYMPLGTLEDLKTQWINLAIQRSCMAEKLPSNAFEFEASLKEGRLRLNLIAQEIGRVILQILSEWAAVNKKLQGLNKSFPTVSIDIERQIRWLLPKNFLLDKPWSQMTHYPRYFKAIAIRLDRLRQDPIRDQARLAEISPLLLAWQKALQVLKGRKELGLDEFGWQLQELRVSLFAQELKTPMPISVKRLQKTWDSIMARSNTYS